MKATLALALLLLFAQTAHACSCVVIGRSPQAAIENAYAVFSGRVVSIEDPASEHIQALPKDEQPAARQRASDDYFAAGGWGPEWGRKITFEVADVWKGTRGKTLDVWTGQGNGDCGYPFRKGFSYVVFASFRRGLMQAGLCSLTTPLLCAKDILVALGEPKDIQPKADEEPYPLYGFECIQWPLLENERGLEMLRGRAAVVNLVVNREGGVSEFAFADLPNACINCSDEMKRMIEQRVRAWMFRPAMANGVPVAVRIERISDSTPKTESEAKEKK